MERDTKVKASELIGIENPIAAFDFDKAVTLRLLIYDNKVAGYNAKLIAYEVSKMFSTDNEQLTTDNEDGYSNGGAEVW